MNDPLPNQPHEEPRSQFPPDTAEQQRPPAAGPGRPRRRRGQTVVAWLVIIALVGLTTVRQAERREEAPADESLPDLDRVVLEAQAKYLVGGADLLGQGGEAFLDSLAPLKEGSLRDRLSFVILSGELAGYGRADEEIARVAAWVRKAETPPRELVPVVGVLARLYGDYARGELQAPSVPAGDRELLRERMGWLGELALAPHGAQPPPGVAAATGAPPAAALARIEAPDPGRRGDVLAPAYRLFAVVAGAGLGVLVFGVLGLVLAGTFAVLVAAGKVKPRLRFRAGNGGLYAETFAVWMALFVAAGVGLALLRLPFSLLSQSLIAMSVSLLALGWPVLRGLSWKRVRHEIGLTGGRGVWTEVGVGVLTYLGCWPLLGLGLLAMFGLLLLQQLLFPAEPGAGVQPAGGAAHPIVAYIVAGDWWQRLQIFLLASVAAPVVEEIMFRGVLYRHARELSRGRGFALSFLFSAALVSFIFAVIHPQGWVAIPVLMALAFGFTVAREWRGSLIPCMVAHGINNGLVLAVVILALGS